MQTARSIGEAYGEHHLIDEASDLPANWQEIHISNLNFSHRAVYNAEKRPQSLHGLDIRIRRGQRIAFIGESGSGKSTLLALLRGLYQPEPGTKVTIDGQTDAAIQMLADHVTLFPQDPEIFENTIDYNITLGLPFEESDIMQVCETAPFAEVVDKLPKRLESSFQEKGVNLSGGQKQRLALARGILAARTSDIVLLDEPTSNIGPKTESQIYDKMFVEFSDKSVISTLHRLHLLAKFDYVYLLQDGYLVDEGTIAHLRQQSTIFQELWRHQETLLRHSAE